jgi:hypothetical protein
MFHVLKAKMSETLEKGLPNGIGSRRSRYYQYFF